MRRPPVSPSSSISARGRSSGLQQAVADRVVDVVVDVGDAVDEPDDLPLERLRLLRAGVREDPVAHLGGEVQLLGDPERLLVVVEAGAEVLAQAAVELVLAGVAERRVAHVVPEPDRLGQILVQPQRSGDDAGDPGRLERVRDPRSVMVAGGIDEDLRLALQPPERLRVHDPVAVALERRPDAALVLLAQPPARLVRADGERRERRVLGRADASLEGVGNSSGQLRHHAQAYSAPRRPRGDFELCNTTPRQTALQHSAVRAVLRNTSPARARSDDDRHGAAVRRPSRAGDVRGLFGREEGDHGGDLLRLGQPAERPPGADLRQHLLAVASCWSASPPSPSHASVAVGPGVTALQRIPSPA